MIIFLLLIIALFIRYAINEKNKEIFINQESKLQEAKERESDELFNYVASNKNENAKFKKKDLVEAFKTYGCQFVYFFRDWNQVADIIKILPLECGI